MTGKGSSQFEVLQTLAHHYRTVRRKAGHVVYVCTGGGCLAAGAESILEAFNKHLHEAGLIDDVALVPTGCLGPCGEGPAALVEPGGVFYGKLTEEGVGRIVVEHLAGGKPVSKFFFTNPRGRRVETIEANPFFSRQTRVLTRLLGRIDPESIASYVAEGGYGGLHRALTELDRDGIIEEVSASGLRGRGGGGFSTGKKWSACRHEKGLEKFVICNADEGDPGAYMDRTLLEGNPHAVIEGLLIGARAVGADLGYIYLREEYTLAYRRLSKAIEQARVYGLLGRSILGTPFHFDLQIVRNAGSLVSGEATALIAFIEGRVGEPRGDYEHGTHSGLWGRPSVVNNVETWANVPEILSNGAMTWASRGVPGCLGTKVFSLVGQVKNTGIVEVPMGTSLKELVETIGGGPSGRLPLKAVQTGGPAGGVLPPSMWETHLDYESLQHAGSMMCTGGIIGVDEGACLVHLIREGLRFLEEEDCGQCVPCREGLPRMREILDRIRRGEGSLDDLQTLEELALVLRDGARCGLGRSAAIPVLSSLDYFREEYLSHIEDGFCPAGRCKGLARFEIDGESCSACGACARACPAGAIEGNRKEGYRIDSSNCVQCGSCREACPRQAIRVMPVTPSERKAVHAADRD